MEVGRAYFETEHKRFTVLDAPGHKNYVPNMIAGASQADAGVVVISSRKGEFESGFNRSGQTREHILLAKTYPLHSLIDLFVFLYGYFGCEEVDHCHQQDGLG